MMESARIARGAVQSLTKLTVDAADAVVIPGGFGAAKNLSDFGFKVSSRVVTLREVRVLELLPISRELT